MILLSLVLTFNLSYGNEKIPIEQLKAFSEVYMKIKKDYVEKVDDEKLFDDAIKGMLEGLDPHSTYLNEKDFEDLQIGTRGEFGGLGIEVTMEDGYVKVVSPIDDTPAYRAGVKAGDLIIMLDDKPVKGLTLSECVDIMRGKVGTSLELTIAREGENKPLKIKIIRDTIKVKSVKYDILDNNYGYLRITSFQSKTGSSLKNVLLKIKKKNNLKGIVLDLRNNPGGVLGAAVEVSDTFLDQKKMIVTTSGRMSDAINEFKSSSNDFAKDIPIVVLINGGSASASEIVAGALQDHRRAIIMGTQSFGKGSVQTILPLTRKTALKITTARYFTPNGRSIQAKGITPDIIVNEMKFEKKDEVEFLKESDLTGHLDKNSKKEKNGTSFKNSKYADDYQLSEALNLLKGLNILSVK
ncbi:MAG: peptidase S41 [Thiotrichaceae bacterium]|nr:S41 family peptidase [Pseudomonadota bacterium]GIR92182.1 MAG: peptidase S41 [Thiotrichaceae bacterium]